MANKDEDAAFYEIYKYLSGLAPFTGPYGASSANKTYSSTSPATPMSCRAKDRD